MIVREILYDHKQGYYKKGKFESGHVHFIRISDISDNAFLDQKSTPMINIELDVIEKFRVKKDDFLFARTGGAGKFCLITEDIHGIYASYLIRFRFSKNYSSYFLRYYFLSDSFQTELKSKIHGGVNQNVHAENIKDCHVPNVVLPEQKRIVAKLDKCFEAIDKARANVEKNLQNAKDLFQSQLNQIFSQKDDGWVVKKFEECCILQRGFDLPKRLRVKGEHLLVSSSGISDTHNEFKVLGPGVTTGRSGSIGRVFFIENNFWPLNTVLYIKNFQNNDEKFIYYLLQHFDLKRYSSGSGVPTLNRNFVHKELISIPTSITEQKRIVIQFDKLKMKTNSLASNYQKELDALDELKKSILQKAFNGEL
jgi:type I restriction enzyme, S subunit